MVSPFHTHSGDISSTNIQFLTALMAAVYHSAQRIWFRCCHAEPMVAISAHCAVWSCKNSPSAVEGERGHPLSHAIFNFLTVAAYARKDNPPGLEAVP